MGLSLLGLFTGNQPAYIRGDAPEYMELLHRAEYD